MKRKVLILGTSLGVLTAASISILGLRSNFLFSGAEATQYTITLNNSDNDYKGGSEATYKTDSKAWDVKFGYENCSSSGEYHVVTSDEEESYIYNIDPIKGLNSVTITYDDFALINIDISNDGVNWTPSNGMIFSGEAFEIPSSNYVRIYTGAPVSITSIQLKYSCLEPEDGPTSYNVSDYYDGYYEDIVSWENGEDLRRQLNTVINTGVNALKYDDGNWDSNTDADHVQDGYYAVDTVYSADDCLSENTNRGWQREHAWCASLMTGSTTGNAVKFLGRSTDFHNLFAGDASGNMSRGNKNFGEANKSADGYTDKTTNNGEDGYSYDKTTFEPGNKDKGRLCRAIFYMATMYMDEVQDTKNGVTMKGLEIVEDPVEYVSGNSCAFQIGNLSTLLDWNNSFGVDRLEMQHNTSVQTHAHAGVVQGNRNPYVDYPELVNYVYGDKKDEPGELKYIKPSITDLGYTPSNKTEHRYYTLKSYKDSFGTGKEFTQDGIVIYDVKKDFSYTTYEGEFTTTYDGHTFDYDVDGSSVTNVITIGDKTISYPITIEAMSACSYYQTLTKTGITNTIIDEAQEVTYGTKKWNVTVSGTSGYYLSNITSGGFKVGSGSKVVTGLTFESKDSMTVDAVYFSCTPTNKDSSFTMKVYVGEDLVNTYQIAYTDGKTFTDYGGALDQEYTGKVKFVFTGSNALSIRALAVNEVPAEE